jgi:hypothetical protein
LSQLVSSAVGEKLSALEAMEMLEEWARKGANVVIDSILAKIPPNEPLEPLDRKM